MNDELLGLRSQLAEQQKELEKESQRWIDRIYEMCKAVCRECGDDESRIDGGGCDSGDPLDFCTSEISQAFQVLRDKYDEELEKLRAEQRWIPVSEKLPENTIAVLVWCPDMENNYCANYELGQWSLFGGNHKCIGEGVTHWRPLPAPPAGEGE